MNCFTQFTSKKDNQMKLYRASARASVERELTRNLFPCQDDNNKKLYRASARASVARNFAWALPKQKGTIK